MFVCKRRVAAQYIARQVHKQSLKARKGFFSLLVVAAETILHMRVKPFKNPRPRRLLFAVNFRLKLFLQFFKPLVNFIIGAARVQNIANFLFKIQSAFNRA